jgi:hypothetical protein
MRNQTKNNSLIAAAAALVVVALFFAWLFSQQSTLGLFQWTSEWKRNFILIGLAGLLPAIISLARLALARLRSEGQKLGAALSIASFVFSAFAILLAGGLFYYVQSSATSIQRPIPAVKLVDPKAGITVSGGTARISLSSDPHWGAETANAQARSAILKSVASALPKRDAFFILGDNVQTGMDDGYWHAEALELASTLGDLPVRPLMGNHDGVIKGQYHFDNYFFPSAGGNGSATAALSSDSGSSLYYSIDAGPAKIIVLNLLWGAESFDAKQAAWLEKTLSATPSGKQVIVLSHCFFYSSGYIDDGMPWYDNKGTIGKVSPILERHKVALVVSGHDHYMELLEHNGLRYAVIGAMGGILDPAPTYVSPASRWLKYGVNGRLDLDVSEKGIELAFRDRDGKALYETRIPAAK